MCTTHAYTDPTDRAPSASSEITSVLYADVVMLFVITPALPPTMLGRSLKVSYIPQSCLPMVYATCIARVYILVNVATAHPHLNHIRESPNRLDIQV